MGAPREEESKSDFLPNELGGFERLPLQGEGWDGDGFNTAVIKPIPTLAPLEREGNLPAQRLQTMLRRIEVSIYHDNLMG